jgi:HEAT repeats
MRTSILVVAILALCSMPARAVDRKAVDAAVERGVAALEKMQRPDGTWNHPDIGATALAGLTLVECGVAKNGRSVKAAADKVRQASYSLTHTYSLALSVIFLDALGEPSDTPLIESMIVRLLAGQLGNGAWSYYCPSISAEEARRLLAESSGRELKGGRDLGKLPSTGKRTVKDLAPAIQAQLQVIARGGVLGRAGGAMPGGDNSNTQFALLGLWVGRRYGVPTQGALVKADQYFRASQGAGGTWGYAGMLPGTMGVGVPGSPTMTCAGILGLAFGHGSILDIKKAKDPKAETRDIGGDAKIKGALQALSGAVGTPVGWDGLSARPAAIPPMSGKGFYYLWSLERVSVALKLETIGKKKWYDWGAELLLANQGRDGAWQGGDFSTSGADTCFALLFLKKANFTRDLSSGLAGLKDPGKLLRVGGVGGDALRTSPADLDKTGIGKKSAPGEKKSALYGEGVKPPKVEIPSGTGKTPRTAEEKAAAKLGDDLVEARGERRAEVLKRMRDARGVAYTEALVASISRLDGDARKAARVALAERLTRMKADTLREYLDDDEPEIRRAAALATAAKKNRSHVPALIRRLSDPELIVRRAAHHALEKLTGKDFGPDDEATVSQRKEAIAAWLKWWQANSCE